MIFLMMVLTINIGVYFVSEDYRFFLKKIKYKEELVYEERDILDEISSNSIEVIQEESQFDELWSDIETGLEENENEYTFLDVLSGTAVLSNEEDTLPELTWSQEQFVGYFDEFNLELLDYNSSLFDLTTEFPDPYYDFYSEDLSLYVFPTKSYEEVEKILEVLSFELPYTLNEVNNFWQNSLYVNIDNAYRDDVVRIVLKYKNKAFWLKIQKDNYNTIKTLLENIPD